ncbi:MAG: helix-turn-helix domain-containing protein [Janthinobacterium lividum]
MSLVDLLTRQDLEPLTAKLDQLLALHAQPAALAAEEQLMSVLDVAKYTHFDRKTVEKWVKEGDYNEKGKRVYLPAYAFSGRLRFKRADVLAFGLSVGALAPTLPGEAPQPVKPAKKTQKPAAAVASAQALRVA